MTLKGFFLEAVVWEAPLLLSQCSMVLVSFFCFFSFSSSFSSRNLLTIVFEGDRFLTLKCRFCLIKELGMDFHSFSFNFGLAFVDVSCSFSSLATSSSSQLSSTSSLTRHPSLLKQ